MEQKAEKNAPPVPTGIVSVNSRGAKGSNLGAKLVFATLVAAVLAVGGLFVFNQWRAKARADKAAAEKSAKSEAQTSAAIGPRRKFDTDPPPPAAAPEQSGTTAGAATAGAQCADGTTGTPMLGPDGKGMTTPNGTPMRVCKDGHVVVPALAQGQGAGQPAPVGMAAGGQRAGQGQGRVPSRFDGDVMVTKASTSGVGGPNGGLQPLGTDPTTMYLQSLIAQQAQKPSTSIGLGAGGQPSIGTGGTSAANPPGSIGTLLQPSQTPAVQATMLGDRNMILPKGRTIDCALTTRVINDVAGMASCVLTQDVYSDNGRVVLAEKGSEATGEYSAAMLQGQRRLFLLWTRLKTTKGVVVNLNSPAADGLGTTGLDGYVDNHWWERIGGAFMLSLVQDAIGYATARQQNSNGGGQSIAVFSNSTNTTNRMAEKVLDSTINIKPTLYKNQGDRTTIYVARDIDFGSVYAIRAR